MRVPKVLLPPQKKLEIFWPKNGPIWPKSVIFGHFEPNIGLSCAFDAMPNQKNSLNKVPRWFFDIWIPKLLIPPPKIRTFGLQNGQILPKICTFGYFGPNIGLSGPFDAMPDHKIMRTRCLGGFLIYWYQNFCFLPK